MKRKSGFIVRKLAGQNVAVAVGERSKSFHGTIKLNESGLFIWNCLENDTTPEQITEKLLAEYDVDAQKALADVMSFIDVLRQADILDE